MNMKNYLIGFIFLLLAFSMGNLFYKSCLAPHDKKANIDASLSINRIEKVLKLVSVEGHYTELFNYDKSIFDFPGFRKKAFIQVTGKVLVGYNLEHFHVQYDDKKKIITIGSFPTPEILSIETNSKYYDMEQGIFNTFSKEELTEIDKKSKEIIRQKALSDHLIQAAEAQKNDLLPILLDPVVQSGWKVFINGQQYQPKTVQTHKD